MKVHSAQPNQYQNKNINFKNAVDTSLRFFATNQALGANAIDIASMVAPRTTSDMIKRGPTAGMETLRREIMGTVNDTLIGSYGILAGSLIAYAMNKKYEVNINKIFTAPETLNILADNKARQLKDKKTQAEYLKETLSNIKAFNPTSKNADKEGFVRLSNDTIEEAAKYFDEALKNENLHFKEWTKDKTVNARNVIMNKITENTGAQSEYILESVDKKITSKSSLKTLLDDIYLVSHSFNKEKVTKAFEEQIKSGKGIKENSFVKGLQKFMKTRAGIGFLMGAAVGMATQPINMYLSKLKTGSDGFVGVEGRSKDNSNQFKVIKAASSVGFFSMILATLKAGPLQFMDKMAFKGVWPTVEQLKGIYGVTIISRIFSARDKDELREVLTKDTLGYLSWLVLGDIINKLTADMLDKSVINYNNKTKDKNIFKRTFNAQLKTRDEILIETLAKNGISTTKENNGKLVAKTFKEMLKDLDKINDSNVKKLTKKRLGTLNKAQLTGYIFSGLVLGLGIPNLNIYVTNMLDKKRKAQKAKQAQTVATA